MWEGEAGMTMTQTPREVSGSAPRLRKVLLATAAGSLAWTLATGGYGVWSWPQSHAALQKDFDEGTRGCRQRYAEKSRQDRCIDLFKVMYQGDRNAGIFTRVVFTLLPPALAFGGLFVWSILARRAAASPPGRRGPSRAEMPPEG